MPKRKTTHAELQSLLDNQIAPPNLQPPVESRLQALPLQQLSWENFERLCARLITKDGAVYECFRYGQPGEDQAGIDLLARRWMDGRVQNWAYQCKKHARLTAVDVRGAVRAFTFRADVYVILISVVASTAVRNEVAKHPNVQLWDAEDISRKLKDHPRLVVDFFGRTWQQAFSDSVTPLAADSSQDAIRQMIGLNLNHHEWLHSNLLPVVQLPDFIYCVPAPLKASSATTPEELALMPPHKTSKAQDKVWCLANLKDPVVAALVGCEPDHVSLEMVDQWLSWPRGRTMLRDLFYEYLRRTCASLGMAYDADHRRLYFTPENGGPRIRTYQAFKQKATRKLAYPYEDKKTKEVRFWVHHAARLAIVDLNQEFYLRVEPGYAFTKNGQDFIASEDIGPLTTRRKSGERNQNVFNHIIFWSEILTDPSGNIRIDCDGQALAFSKMYESAKANFGIPSDSAPIEEVAMAEDEFDLELMVELENGEDTE